ncbi:hypothetical protein ACN24K_09135 [Streptomyces microflavus]
MTACSAGSSGSSPFLAMRRSNSGTRAASVPTARASRRRRRIMYHVMNPA